MAYQSQFDIFVSASTFPPKPSNVEPQTWFPKASGGFEVLNWQPSDKVLGSYEVTISETDFLITVKVDIDGNGKEEIYTATKHMSPDSKFEEIFKISKPFSIESELISNVKAIKVAEISYESNFDVFVAATAYPASPTRLVNNGSRSLQVVL